MKTCSVLAALVWFARAVSFAQDHTPAVAQCQAEHQLWSSAMDESISRLSFQNLRERVVEMSQCAVVDEVRAYHYMNLVSQYLLAREVRLNNFLERHNLATQFLAEDGARKRYSNRGLGISKYRVPAEENGHS
jgi:hypothetical protein